MTGRKYTEKEITERFEEMTIELLDMIKNIDTGEGVGATLALSFRRGDGFPIAYESCKATGGENGAVAASVMSLLEDEDIRRMVDFLSMYRVKVANMPDWANFKN